jgi:hypothetical protein
MAYRKNITPVTVGDLVDQIGTPEPRAILYCERCGAEYSANKGDYFMLPNDYVFECCQVHGFCGLMRLVVKQTVYREVAA